jgi:hypothetical protein
MAPNFYLHVSAIGRGPGPNQPLLKLDYGPFASLEEARAKHNELTHEPGYEYTIRINQEPESK